MAISNRTPPTPALETDTPTNVHLLPTAANAPVVNAPLRGRLPAGVRSLKSYCVGKPATQATVATGSEDVKRDRNAQFEIAAILGALMPMGSAGVLVGLTCLYELPDGAKRTLSAGTYRTDPGAVVSHALAFHAELAGLSRP